MTERPPKYSEYRLGDEPQTELFEEGFKDIERIEVKEWKDKLEFVIIFTGDKMPTKDRISELFEPGEIVSRRLSEKGFVDAGGGHFESFQEDITYEEIEPGRYRVVMSFALKKK